MLRSILALMMTGAMVSGCITPPPSAEAPPPRQGQAAANDDAFQSSEVVEEIEEWLGVSAQTAGQLVERTFSDLGEPNAYIYGEEASGAIGAGLRYGRGTLVMADGRRQDVFWQGPSIGWDLGGNASKTFTLVYDLPTPDMIYRRFPGVEGTAYLIGGVGANYQRAENITLVPMRAGVGARLGANIGYLAYSREQRIVPF